MSDESGDERIRELATSAGEGDLTAAKRLVMELERRTGRRAELERAIERMPRLYTDDVIVNTGLTLILKGFSVEDALSEIVKVQADVIVRMRRAARAERDFFSRIDIPIAPIVDPRSL